VSNSCSLSLNKVWIRTHTHTSTWANPADLIK
jgi:hypothetical protein